MYSKKIFISMLLGAMSLSSAAYAAERDDVAQILREIQFIKEATKQLQRKYRNKNQGKIQFNYKSLIVQLETAEQGIKPYLNGKITEIHLTPPKPVVNQLFNVRKN